MCERERDRETDRAREKTEKGEARCSHRTSWLRTMVGNPSFSNLVWGLGLRCLVLVFGFFGPGFKV